MDTLRFTGKTTYDKNARQGIGAQVAIFVRVHEGQEAEADSLMKAFHASATPHVRGGIVRFDMDMIKSNIGRLQKLPVQALTVEELKKGLHSLLLHSGDKREDKTAWADNACLKNRISYSVFFTRRRVSWPRLTTRTTFSRKSCARKFPCKPVYEDDHVLAFHDITPKAPKHILVIPKGAYVDMNDFSKNASPEEITALFRAVGVIATQQSLDTAGYRIISNCGSDGGQEVPHLHLHLLGGRRLGRMVQEG